MQSAEIEITANHIIKDKDIVIEEGVWIGAKSIVCGGVTCHSHSVLSVNSVATKSLDAYSIFQGNPARLVRQREIAIR